MVGLVPILGNLISNTVIFLVSISHSLGIALYAYMKSQLRGKGMI